MSRKNTSQETKPLIESVAENPKLAIWVGLRRDLIDRLVEMRQNPTDPVHIHFMALLVAFKRTIYLCRETGDRTKAQLLELFQDNAQNPPWSLLITPQQYIRVLEKAVDQDYLSEEIAHFSTLLQARRKQDTTLIAVKLAQKTR